MIRAPAVLLGLLLAAFPTVAQQVPDPISKSELGTVRSEGGNPPNADVITRFYAATNVAGDTVSYSTKPQFQVSSDPDASDWAIEQPGKQNQGATRLCTTSLGTTSDCNYVSLGKGSKHLFANGAGPVAEMSFLSIAVPPATTGYANGWVSLVGRNDAVGQIQAAGTTNVDLELKPKGSGQVSVGSSTSSGALLSFLASAGTAPSQVSSPGYGVQVQGHRFITQTTAGTISVPAEDSGKHYHNTGASSTTTFNLPAAVVTPGIAGANFCFSVDAAFSVVVKAAGTDKIAFGSSNSAAGGTISANQPYASACITLHKTGQWFVWATADKTQWTVT